MLRFFLVVAIFRWILLNFRCIKTGAGFCRNSTRAYTNKIPEKNMCCASLQRKMMLMPMFRFYYRRNRLLLTVYKRHLFKCVHDTVHTYIISREFHTFFGFTYTLCHHRSHYYSCFVDHFYANQCIQPTGNFYDSDHFSKRLWIIFFFILPQKPFLLQWLMILCIVRDWFTWHSLRCCCYQCRSRLIRSQA